jgi:very-short-patch-repair endonuclease
MRAIGFSEAAIRRRVRRGALHRIFRGAFLVGHAMAVPGARELAAVLACGHDAVVSHRSAAALWGLAAQFPACVEVSMTTGHRRCHGELVVHRPRRLEANDRTMKNGIPITSPVRTLVDFAATATPDELERALAQARVQRLVSDQALAGALDRARKRAGVVALRAALRQERGPQLTRSEAERRLLQMIRVAGLAEPVANARVAGYEVDFLWPDARVIVEVDGFAFHSHRSAFERDRTRDMVLRDAGYEVIRVTWRQIVEQPLRVVAHIARALARSQFVG